MSKDTAPRDEMDSSAEDPSGEHLGDDLPDPGDYTVVDDEAEELDGSDDLDEADEDDTDDDLDQDDADGDLETDLDQDDADGDLETDPEGDEPDEDERPVAAVKKARPKRRLRIDDEDQLEEAEETAAEATSSRPVKRTRTTAPVRKSGSARSSRSRTTTVVRRTTPAGFVRQSVGELRKVIWPTGDQLGQYFVVVLVFVLLMIAYVGGLDMLLGWAMLKLLGHKEP